MVEIGFNDTVYSVDEGETVVVCVELSGPEVIDDKLISISTISTIPGTATGEPFSCLYTYIAPQTSVS